MNTEYPKIENLFTRDEKTGKLIIGKFRRFDVESLFDASYPMEITEKIDGMNTRVIWDGKQVRFAGRTDKAVLPKPLLAELGDKFMPEKMRACFGAKHVVVYGEGCGRKIQEPMGRAYSDLGQFFVMFDVLVEGVWLERDNMHAIAGKFCCPSAPLLSPACLCLHDALRRVPRLLSRLALPGYVNAEGVVCKPAGGLCDRQGKRIIVKIKRKDLVILEDEVREFLSTREAFY